MNARLMNTPRWIHITTGIMLAASFVLMNRVQLETLRSLQGVSMLMTLGTAMVLFVPFARSLWRQHRRRRASRKARGGQTGRISPAGRKLTMHWREP